MGRGKKEKKTRAGGPAPPLTPLVPLGLGHRGHPRAASGGGGGRSLAGRPERLRLSPAAPDFLTVRGKKPDRKTGLPTSLFIRFFKRCFILFRAFISFILRFVFFPNQAIFADASQLLLPPR